MLERDKNSHKGDNGKVMIVGGGPLFYGAPILSALAAEHSGVDLVYPFIPKMHSEAAKTYSLNFIIQTFEGETLTAKDARAILNFSKQVDVVVIGPGLGTDSKTASAVKTILSKLEVPTVVDASALVYTNHLPEVCVLTPHRGEFKELTGEDPSVENVQKWSRNLNATILCKGPEDIIADRDELAINNTGTPLMTVGGTGDVLAGYIGGLIAQGMEPFDACKLATRTLGILAENLEQLQDSCRAIDLVYSIPSAMTKF